MVRPHLKVLVSACIKLFSLFSEASSNVQTSRTVTVKGLDPIQTVIISTCNIVVATHSAAATAC